MNIAMHDDTIVAVATPPGVGAIAIIRLSGKNAIQLADKVFYGKELNKVKSHTLHFGTIKNNEQIIDEVVVSVFKKPHSFTKEDTIEISCHGSPYIVKNIITLFIDQGARMAQAGEFTQRAFLNGRFDLAQAEAVADLIQADSSLAHQTALHQMRGGFSDKIKKLREQLVHFASLIELELDFSEEDVAFASREELEKLVIALQQSIEQLLESFTLGNVIKQGVPTVIAGKPNVGKSTLLNTLLNEERAIVSDIPGTTRDVIEDEVMIGGIRFRFMDTAGLRETSDTVEAIGVKRTEEKMKQASLIIYLFDLSTEISAEITKTVQQLKLLNTPFILVGNKLDNAASDTLAILQEDERFILISAQQGTHVSLLKDKILNAIHVKQVAIGDTIVTNTRHYESLRNTYYALQDVLKGLKQGITNDFLAQDIRHASHYLGEITGEITTDDLLGNIFSKFCIGK